MDAIVKPADKTAVRKAPHEIARPSREQAEAAVRTLLAYLGDDPEREGLLDTPKRAVVAAMGQKRRRDHDPYAT